MRLNQYTVEKTGLKNIPYRLTGPNGGVVRMVRNLDQPELLFAINNAGRAVLVDGSNWFSDATGQLEAVA